MQNTTTEESGSRASARTRFCCALTSGLLQAIAEVVIQLFVDVIGYGTARLLIHALSFGMLRVESRADKLAKNKWLPFSRRADGKIVVGADPASLIGLVMLIALIAAAAQLAPAKP